MRPSKIAPLLALGALSLSSPGAVLGAEVPHVAAAADLRYVLGEIAERFRKDTGRDVHLTYGSSGTFAVQLEQGAPFELFLSADERFVFRLADAGLTRDRGLLYAVGRLVLFVPHGSRLRAEGDLGDLRAALADGRLQRLAVANPAHAPYGRAARAALEHAGLWAAIQPRLVLGEDASQAMRFAASGSSEGGLVPLSLAKAPQLAGLGAFALVPAEWHATEPLRQRMVLLKGAGAAAQAFYAYLQRPLAREAFVRYGFALPGEVAR